MPTKLVAQLKVWGTRYLGRPKGEGSVGGDIDIEMHFKELEYDSVDGIHLALVNTVMNVLYIEISEFLYPSRGY